MDNKLLVITGGSKGIGRSIILKFVKYDFDIITCSRNLDDLSKLKRDIEKISNIISVKYIEADLSLQTGCDKFVLL